MRSPLLVGILLALGACSEDDKDTYEDEGCAAVDEAATTCAPAKDVSLGELSLPGQCGLDIVGVHGAGTRKNITQDDGTVVPSCCYTVDVHDPDPNGNCVVGRPYAEGGMLLVAATGEDGTEGARAAAWLRAGAGEHASVAAFARLSLQLMAHGAPMELLLAVHEAAADEVRHAALCWEMARQLGAGEVVSAAHPGSTRAPDIRTTSHM